MHAATRQYDRTARGPLCKHWHCPVVRFCFSPVAICVPEAALSWRTMCSTRYLPPLFATHSRYRLRLLVFLGSCPRAFDATSCTTYSVRKREASRTEIYHPRTAGYHLERGFFGAVTGQKESARNCLVVFALMAATCGGQSERE